MDIEKEILDIKERNLRVETDKAWEQSWTRKFSISAITYLTACTFLYFIEVPNFYLAGIVPALGYLLSTLSLPFVKARWSQRTY